MFVVKRPRNAALGRVCASAQSGYDYLFMALPPILTVPFGELKALLHQVRARALELGGRSTVRLIYGNNYSHTRGQCRRS